MKKVVKKKRGDTENKEGPSLAANTVRADVSSDGAVSRVIAGSSGGGLCSADRGDASLTIDVALVVVRTSPTCRRKTHAGRTPRTRQRTVRHIVHITHPSWCCFGLADFHDASLAWDVALGVCSAWSSTGRQTTACGTSGSSQRTIVDVKVIAETACGRLGLADVGDASLTCN